MDLVKNVKRMFANSDGHVHLLAASIRSLEQLLYCFALETELVTAPGRVLEQWAAKELAMPDPEFRYSSRGKPIPYQELDLEQPWEGFDIQHELTRKGIERFTADYHAIVSDSRGGSDLPR